MKIAKPVMVLLLALSVVFLSMGPAFSGSFKEGDTVENIDIALLELGTDKNISLADYIGKKNVFFNFMQSACSACRGEIAFIKNEVEPAKDTIIFFINVDTDPARAAKHKEALKIPHFVLSDAEFKLPVMFGVSYTPSSVFIDKDGKVVRIIAGYNQDVKSEIKELLEK